jgi:hypothetical protein
MNKLNYILFAILLLGLSTTANTNTFESEPNEIQRVRIDFHTPLGFTRHLLLAFTPDNAASDGVDYGYDALNFDNYPDDMNWIISDQRYVIQGVGEFNVSKSYPLAMFLSNSGTVGISLNSLENFETEIDVYVYDALLGTFETINTQNYATTLENGNYLDRFYITFTSDINQINIPNNSLSISDNYFENTSIHYLYQSNELMIDSKNEFVIREIKIYNLNAQEIYKVKVNTDKIKVPLQFIKSNALLVEITSSSGAQYMKRILIH